MQSTKALNRVTCHLLGGAGLCNSQAHTQDSIGSQLGLVLCAIELDQKLVDLGLILDIEPFLQDSRSNDVVDVGYGLQDTLSIPFGLISIAQFACLVLAC